MFLRNIKRCLKTQKPHSNCHCLQDNTRTNRYHFYYVSDINSSYDDKSKTVKCNTQYTNTVKLGALKFTQKGNMLKTYGTNTKWSSERRNCAKEMYKNHDTSSCLKRKQIVRSRIEPEANALK